MAVADREKALEAALAQIEKQHGKGSIMRLGDQSHAQIEVIPTGSIALDVALGIGGLPRGRIVEVYGPESSGKTTVALHAIANAQAELEAAEARLAALEGSGIEQAREGVRLAELSYRAGKSSLVEYIDAQQAYAATQAELIAARQARAEARAILSRQAAADGDADHQP